MKRAEIHRLFDEVIQTHGIREAEIFLRAYSGDVGLAREKLGPFLLNVNRCPKRVLIFCQKLLNSGVTDDPRP